MKPYQDYTVDELLSELVEFAYKPVLNAERIEALKAEIKKRIALLEAHQK